jgi:hypothetical protein
VAPDGSLDENLGQAVATSPGWAICTAPGDDFFGTDSGAIYVFQDTGSGWTFAQKLKAVVPAAGSNLGQSVAISGEWLVAGAPQEAPFGGSFCGTATVFRLEAGTWVHSQTILPSDPQQTYHMGASADLSGDRMVLGTDGGGAVRVFERSGSTWVEIVKLFSPDPDAGAHRFGLAVAIEGDTLLVGSPWAYNGVQGSFQGAVYVFERDASTWQFKQKLVASDAQEDDWFGYSVALDGDTLLVGRYYPPTKAGSGGAMYVFERQGGIWSQTAKLLASDPASLLTLGASVDLQGNLAVGSAPGDDDHGHKSASAYVFRRNAGGAWLQIAKAIAPDSNPNALFGSDVSLLGDQVLIGAAGEDLACAFCDDGAAYVFLLAPDSVQYGSCPTQGPCGNHDDFGGCVNSSGTGGELSAAGSSSVSTDNLHLQARWLPANKLGLFFMGGMPTSMPFGDGHLCVTSGGMGVWRFNPAQTTGALGVMNLGPGVAGLSNSLPPGGHIQAGQIWHFQAWFRDPAGPCGQGSNMTNAVRVMFGP